jgi:hypothetical protein
MMTKSLRQQYHMSITPGILMMLDLSHPVLVLCEPFEKPWRISDNLEITYYWVTVLDGDEELTIEAERLTHMEA